MKFISFKIEREKIYLILFLFLTIPNNAIAFEIKITQPLNQQHVDGVVDINASMYRNASDKNLSYHEINRLFEEVQTDFPKEILKVIGYVESNGWQQFDKKGKVFKNINYLKDDKGKIITGPTVDIKKVSSIDYGLMQINNKGSGLNPNVWDFDLIKSSTEYNIKAGIAVLEGKRQWLNRVKKNRKDKWRKWVVKYDLSEHSEMDVLLKSYNGFRKSWEYVDMINEKASEKPWAKAVDVLLEIGSRKKDAKTIKRSEIYHYSWNTLKEEEGTIELRTTAKTNIAEKDKEYSDKINVLVAREKNIKTFKFEDKVTIFDINSKTGPHAYIAYKFEENLEFEKQVRKIMKKTNRKKGFRNPFLDFTTRGKSKTDRNEQVVADSKPRMIIEFDMDAEHRFRMYDRRFKIRSNRDDAFNLEVYTAFNERIAFTTNKRQCHVCFEVNFVKANPMENYINTVGNFIELLGVSALGLNFGGHGEPGNYLKLTISNLTVKLVEAN